MNLHVSRNGSLAILLAEGRIGWDSSRLMDTRVRTLVQGEVTHIVFQLEVDFLSSGAIGVLVYYLRNLQKSKGDIFLVASRPYVKELLQGILGHPAQHNAVRRPSNFRPGRAQRPRVADHRDQPDDHPPFARHDAQRAAAQQQQVEHEEDSLHGMAAQRG